MKKIISLTEHQTRRLIEFREEWRTIGLTPGPVTRAAVEPVFAEIYRSINLKPVPLIVLPSPASVLLVLALPMIATVVSKKTLPQRQLRVQLWSQLKDQLGGQFRDQLGGQLRDQLRDQLGGQLRDQLWDQLRGQLGGQLWDQLGVQLEGQLRGQLWDQLWVQLRGQLWGQLRDQLRDQLERQLGKSRDYYFGGHCEVYWICFYRFCEELGCIYTEQNRHQLGWWETLARHCGWWWPHEKFILASARPQTRWNAARQLHAEDGPAIAFSDGYQVWSLNGVRVPPALVTTAAHDLDPHEWVLKQSSAEVRREAVRKIGIERVCAQLKAHTMDRSGTYELLRLRLNDNRTRPYLKMVNPSTGTYHLEGVPPNITTIQEALTWRNQSDQHPLLLT